MSSSQLVIFEIRNSRESEESPLAMEQVFASLGSSGGHGGCLAMLFGHKHAPKYFSLEIVSVNSAIHFFLAVPSNLSEYIESQLTAQYPKLLLAPITDYAPHFLSLPHAVGQMVQGNSVYFPIKTSKDVKDLDILTSLVGHLAKLSSQEAISMQ